MKKRLLYFIFPVITLILEILPYGAVCNFASGPDEIHRKTFSYFDLLPFGYANFAPFLTAICTCVILIMLLVYALTGKYSVINSAKTVVFIGVLLSLCPLLYGISYFSFVGAMISVSLLAEWILLLATAKFPISFPKK